MLRTKRLILRPSVMEDLNDFNGFLSDPRAMAHWSTAPHPDLETSREQLADMVAAQPPITYFMFEYQARVIGMGGMHHGNEVAFMLHPDYWRQGFVTEAMTAILDHIWATTDEALVPADADPKNAASVGLLRALGFRETHRAQRTFCINGVWSDSVYLALERRTHPPQKRKDQIMSQHDRIADRIVEAYVESLAGDPSRGPVTTTTSDRQILIVKQVVHTVSNFIQSSTDTTPQCRAGVTLTGAPSASSDVEKAYLTFVPASELRTPFYRPERKTLWLWFEETYQAATLEALRAKNLYCWVGVWPNGHVYGDIHAHDGIRP